MVGIAGGSIGGLVLAIIGVMRWDDTMDFSSYAGSFGTSAFVAMALFVGMAVALARLATRPDRR